MVLRTASITAVNRYNKKMHTRKSIENVVQMFEYELIFFSGHASKSHDQLYTHYIRLQKRGIELPEGETEEGVKRSEVKVGREEKRQPKRFRNDERESLKLHQLSD